MLDAQLAVQMYTIRDYTKSAPDLAVSLRKLAEIGYRAVQLSAVDAMNGDTPLVSASEVRKLLEVNGLRCVATHRSWDDLAGKTDQEIAFHQTLGCDYTAIGGLPGRYSEQGETGFRQFLLDSAPVIAQLKAAGIRFGYHNHDWEFRRVEDDGQRRPSPRTLFDLFIEEGGPDFTLELDVYWADHAGVNPVRLLERCPGRMPVIHIKDKEVVKGEGPVMAAIGEGNLDWAGLLPACRAAGVEWYAVEQDVCRRDPFDCLRSSFDYLTSMSF